MVLMGLRVVCWETANTLLDSNDPRYEHFDNIVSLGWSQPQPPNIEAEVAAGARLLRLDFADIEKKDPRFGNAEPISYQQCEELVAFLASCRGKTLIHCAAGVSRSTAAGFILLCMTMDSEHDALKALSLVCENEPHPNRRVVWMSDRIMGRKRRIINAYRRIYGGPEDPHFVDWSYQ